MMKLRDFSDKAAIAGVGNTPFGALYKKRDPRRNAYTLGLEAFENALEDSGLRKEDIDGVIVSRIPSYSKMCAMAGIKNPRLSNGLMAEGRMSGIALQYAAMAVHTGMANVVACIYGNDGQSAGVTYGSEPEMIQYTKPLPTPNDFDKPYWTALKEHELKMQKCLDCGKIWFPPNPVCPECLSHNYEWIKLSGKGKVWSWVIFHQLYFPSFADGIPYNVVAVKLDEGPLLTSNIVECKNEDIRCDMPVEVFFDDVTELITLAKFRPAGSTKPNS